MTPSEPVSAPFPHGTLALELTAKCNRHCVYCYNTWREGGVPQQPELNASQWIDLVNRVCQETGRTHLQITGGEPLLRPDLFEIVAGIRRPGRKISMVTDGGLLTQETVGRLAELGVGPVQPTLLAARREVHDGLKGAASFDATLTAISWLLKAKVPVSVSFVCTSKNAQHFEEVIELCFALGVRTVALSRLCVAGSGSLHREALMPTLEQIRSCMDVAIKAKRLFKLAVPVAISLPHCALTDEQRREIGLGRCAVGTASPGFTIDPWGRLRACSVSSTVLGDLLTETFSEIVSRNDTNYFSVFRTNPDECRGCALEAPCGGGCRESAAGIWGSWHRADPLRQGLVRRV